MRFLLYHQVGHARRCHATFLEAPRARWPHANISITKRRSRPDTQTRTKHVAVVMNSLCRHATLLEREKKSKRGLFHRLPLFLAFQMLRIADVCLDYWRIRCTSCHAALLNENVSKQHSECSEKSASSRICGAICASSAHLFVPQPSCREMRDAHTPPLPLSKGQPVLPSGTR